ncbi:unnamed protein product [Adineta steineri]|uniref:Amidase domain-containing protein n=1 Tax=Adineta steineri TaxID=433720 RepID=A0A815JN13_9BILA|nr:unnamed protein product [Adineta steineri]
MTHHRRQLITDLDTHLTKLSIPYQCRKSSLSYGIWNTSLNMIEIIQQHRSAAKCFQSMGITKYSKLYIYPEEAIYMMQSSLLQVSLNNSNEKHNFPLSLDEAYSLWFNQSLLNLQHLHVYQYLTRIGFILIRHQSQTAIVEKKEIPSSVTTHTSKRKRSEYEEESVEHQENEHNDETYLCPIHLSSDCQRLWFPNYTDESPINIKNYPRLIFPSKLSSIQIDWVPSDFNTKISNVQLTIYENNISIPRPSYSLIRSIDLQSHATIYQRLSSFSSQSDETIPPSVSSNIFFDMYTPRKSFRKTQPGPPDYYIKIQNGNDEFNFKEIYKELQEKTLTAVVHKGDMLPIYSWSISIVVGLFILNWCRNRLKQSNYRSIANERAQRKRQARDKHREELLHLLRTKYSTKLPERSIVERISRSTAVELLDGLEKNEFTYTQVILVLSLRSIKIGKEINCTTEEFFDQAIEYAEQFDKDHTNNHEKLLLKGIPISIKDHIDQKGADSSMGIAMKNFRPSSKDSLIVQLLKEQGALAGFVRTSTIQGMMLPETENETYGIATNPFNSTRTTGGSSGGCGALVASCGTPISIGTDIGGSIRIPAHFCGIFGFKPTPGRVSNVGITVPSPKNIPGETNIRATAGPLARCTDDLVLVMRSFLQENLWHNDPYLCRQPWRDERFQDKKRLTIGFYTNDNWFPPAPACIRAVNEAADALRKLGHTVIPYTPINVQEAMRLILGIIGADGAAHFLESLENEPYNPIYRPLVYAAKLPNFLRPFLARLMCIVGERRNANTVRSIGSKSAYEYFDLIIDLKNYMNTWLDDLRKNKIDLLLTPVNALPAFRRGQSGHLFNACSYTCLFNVLHLPAGVVPMTLVRDDEQYYEDIGHLNNDIALSMAKETCRQSAGLPVGVQLVGWPNDDERVLCVMKELESSIEKIQSRMSKFAETIDIFTD